MLVLTVVDNGIFIGQDGKPSRSTPIDWPAPPEETALVQPYVFSVLPAGTVPISQIEGESVSQPNNPSFIGTTVVEIRSSITLAPVQTLPVPFIPTISETPQILTNQTVRVLTPSPPAKSPLFLVTTPTDRATSTAEGSTIWQFHLKPWGEQVHELVVAEAYADALSLLESIEATLLPDKVCYIVFLKRISNGVYHRKRDCASFVGCTLCLNTVLENSVTQSPHLLTSTSILPKW